MLSWIIQISIISIIFIFLVHHLISFFKSTLTVPKIKDLVNSPIKKYQGIFDTISNSNTNKIDSSFENSYVNENSYTDINLLPTENTNPNSNSNSNTDMKDELKMFLKKQLNPTQEPESFGSTSFTSF
jgi:cell shape-determining protein MreC